MLKNCLRRFSFARWFLLALFVQPVLTAQADDSLLTPVPSKPAAPALQLPSLAGDSVELAQFANQVVVLNFWATWCPPCRDEMPSMERAWQELKARDIALLAVSVGEDADTVQEFLNVIPVSFPILLDEHIRALGDWPAHSLPTTFVIDRQGRIVYRALGAREWDDPELLALIYQLAAPTSVTAERRAAR